MNIKHYGIKRFKLTKRLEDDDKKYLQRKISGRSVYGGLKSLYSRRPKHRKLWYQYEV